MVLSILLILEGIVVKDAIYLQDLIIIMNITSLVMFKPITTQNKLINFTYFTQLFEKIELSFGHPKTSKQSHVDHQEYRSHYQYQHLSKSP